MSPYIQEVTTHKEILESLVGDFVDDLLVRVEKHDDDKLDDPVIVDAYEEAFDELDNYEFGSPEYNAVFERPAMKTAKRTHFEASPHHPEFFDHGVKDMSLLEVVEMCFDWIAANQRMPDQPPYLKEAFEFCCKKFGIGGVAKDWLINTALQVAEERDYTL